MAITLEELLIQIARDGIAAQCAVKQQSAEFFRSLFRETDDGDYEPSTFAIQLIAEKVYLPTINMMSQDQFAMKELDLEFETDANLTIKDDQILVDVTMKRGLLKRNANLKVRMKLKSEESTEGIEQIRAHLADRFADELTKAKREREETVASGQ